MRHDIAKLVSAPLVVLCTAGVLAACSGNKGVPCNADTIYLEADSIDPLRIPDGLSVPDETESLRVPAVLPAVDPDDESPGGCLDASPAFAEGE